MGAQGPRAGVLPRTIFLRSISRKTVPVRFHAAPQLFDGAAVRNPSLRQEYRIRRDDDVGAVSGDRCTFLFDLTPAMIAIYRCTVIAAYPGGGENEQRNIG